MALQLSNSNASAPWACSWMASANNVQFFRLCLNTMHLVSHCHLVAEQRCILLINHPPANWSGLSPRGLNHLKQTAAKETSDNQGGPTNRPLTHRTAVKHSSCRTIIVTTVFTNLPSALLKKLEMRDKRMGRKSRPFSGWR